MCNTVIFLGVGINLKLFLALLLSGYFAVDAALDPLAQRHLHPALGGAVDPDDLLVPLDAELRMGDAQQPAVDVFGIEGPWWLVKPDLAFGSVIFVHIWKYLPFWTLILLAGRMAIPTDLYEAARIDGASPLQQFWYVTWPQLRNLYITSLLLSTIWSLGDFNSVYLLTGGGPADKTHVLATLGHPLRLQPAAARHRRGDGDDGAAGPGPARHPAAAPAWREGRAMTARSPALHATPPRRPSTIRSGGLLRGSARALGRRPSWPWPS